MLGNLQDLALKSQLVRHLLGLRGWSHQLELLRMLSKAPRLFLSPLIVRKGSQMLIWVRGRQSRLLDLKEMEGVLKLGALGNLKSRMLV